MSNPFQSLLQIILPKKRPNKAGLAAPPTYNAQAPENPLAVPQYRDHLTSVSDNRVSQDSRALIKTLARTDSDMSATFHAYLTVADTPLWYIVRDENNQISPDGMQLVESILTAITQRFDYTKPGGFELRSNMQTLSTNLRYMLMLRGAIGVELVLSDAFLPTELRLIDMASVEWKETAPGRRFPEQVISGNRVSLDIPTFFVSHYRKDPTDAYSYSPFISAINTIAARQQVIENLYRIMVKTGFPRIHVKVLEEVLRKSAPADCRSDESKMRLWLAARLGDITSQVNNMRADSAFVTFDSVEPSIFNSSNPAASLDISSVIQMLNEQNQAALKVMGTVIGRGESGVNTASVEARFFSMQAEGLNAPVAELLGNVLTLAARLHGFMGYVEVGFDPVDLRPQLELEPQHTMKQARYLELLSLGLIDDQTFHIELFGRAKPQNIPDLSGTGFMTKVATNSNTAQDPAPNALDKASVPPGSDSAKSNTVKKTPGLAKTPVV